MKKTGALAPAKRFLLGQKLWGVLSLSALLGVVFALYMQPHLVIMLSDQLWACF